MRLLVSMVALVLALVAVVLLLQMSSQASREARAAGWAHSLVWHALALPVAPRFLDSDARRESEDSERWVVSGRFEADPATGPLGPRDYVASLRQVCGDAQSADCWRLQDLVVAGQTLVRSEVPDPAALRAAGFAAASASEQGSAPEEDGDLSMAGRGGAAMNGSAGAGAEAGTGIGAGVEASERPAAVEEPQPALGSATGGGATGGGPTVGGRPVSVLPVPRARPAELGS